MSTWDPAGDETPPRRKLPLGVVAVLIAVGIGGGVLTLIAVLASGTSERAAQKEPSPAANERPTRNVSDVDRAPAPVAAEEQPIAKEEAAPAPVAGRAQPAETQPTPPATREAAEAGLTPPPPQEAGEAKEAAEQQPVASIEDTLLFQAYTRNEASADLKYTGKIVEIWARRWPLFDYNPRKNANDQYYLSFNGGTGWVQVVFRPSEQEKLAAFPPPSGSKIVMRGKCQGIERDIVLVSDAVLVSVIKGAYEDDVPKRARLPAKPAQTNLEQQTVLELAEVIRDEMRRANAAAAARRRDPTFNPLDVGQQIPDPHAKTKELFHRQAEERAALANRTVEGKAKFLGARRNAAGAWIATLQVDVSGTLAKVLAYASDAQVDMLKKWKVGDTILVQGKITNSSFKTGFEDRAFGDAQLHVFSCTFNSR